MNSTSPTELSTADRDGGGEGRDAAAFSRVNTGRTMGARLFPVNFANVAIYPLDHGSMQ